MLLFSLIIAIVAGIIIILSRVINASLAAQVGILQGTLVNYLVGLLTSIIVMIVMKQMIPTTMEGYTNIPAWAYFGGLCGVVVVALSSYLVPRISAFYLTLFIFVGQLVSGMLIDFFLSSGISLGKIFGGSLVFIGLSYNLLLDRKVEANEKGCLN